MSVENVGLDITAGEFFLRMANDLQNGEAEAVHPVVVLRDERTQEDIAVVFHVQIEAVGSPDDIINALSDDGSVDGEESEAPTLQ